jgi:hypothetical protein
MHALTHDRQAHILHQEFSSGAWGKLRFYAIFPKTRARGMPSFFPKARYSRDRRCETKDYNTWISSCAMLGSTAPRRWWLMCQSMPKIASLLLLLKQCEQERPRLWMPWPQRPPQLPLSKASLIAFSRCLMSRDSKTFFRYPKRFFLGRNIPKLYVDHSRVSKNVFSIPKSFFFA